MDISNEELRSNIANLADEEIIVRWRSGAFSEEALEIARHEIEKRELDVSDVAGREIAKDEARAKAATKKRATQGIKRFLLIIFAFVVSTIGAVIAALLIGKSW